MVGRGGEGGRVHAVACRGEGGVGRGEGRRCVVLREGRRRILLRERRRCILLREGRSRILLREGRREGRIGRGEGRRERSRILLRERRTRILLREGGSRILLREGRRERRIRRGERRSRLLLRERRIGGRELRRLHRILGGECALTIHRSGVERLHGRNRRSRLKGSLHINESLLGLLLQSIQLLLVIWARIARRLKIFDSLHQTLAFHLLLNQHCESYFILLLSINLFNLLQVFRNEFQKQLPSLAVANSSHSLLDFVQNIHLI